VLAAGLGAVLAMVVGSGGAGAAGGPGGPGGPGGAAGSDASSASAIANVSIICLNSRGTRYIRKQVPVHCAHFGPGGSFAGGVNLKKLDWSKWTRVQGKAMGRECGFQLPCSSITARVSAYRVRRRCGVRVYTRLKSISGYGTTRVKLKGCPQQA
jgi:hypothetical protein